MSSAFSSKGIQRTYVRPLLARAAEIIFSPVNHDVLRPLETKDFRPQPICRSNESLVHFKRLRRMELDREECLKVLDVFGVELPLESKLPLEGPAETRRKGT